MYSRKSEDWVRIAVLVLVCGLVLLIFPASTSILFPQRFADSLVFNIIGEGWANGAVPYVRLFDHKGPLLYFIQILGGWISPGKIGIFILELLCTVLTFELLFRCGRVLGASLKLNYAALAVGIVLYAAYIDGGNCVEEWSLPFEILPLLLALKFFKGRFKSAGTIALVSGLCFGAVAMLRINDNCIICGVVIGMAIYMCRRKQFRQLLICIGLFLAGMVAALLPFVVYFYSVGALEDMIYANFIFNIHYKASWSDPMTFMSFARNFVRLLPCVLLPVICWYYDRKKSEYSLFPTLTAVAAITFVVFISGNGFGHYYLMSMPLAALCVQMASWRSTIVKAGIAFVIVFPVVAYYISMPVDRIRTISELRSSADKPALRDFILEEIPESERTSIYTFGVPEVAGELMSAGYLPAGKYFFMQVRFPKVDEFVRKDIIRDFKECDPIWVISSHEVPSKNAVPLDSTNYREIPVDSLPAAFPREWHLYRRR